MKKYYMLFAAVAAMTAMSCNKELGQSDGSVSTEKSSLIQVTVGDPDPCVVEEGDVDTKVSSFRIARNPKWDAGDAFQLFAYTASKTETPLLTDWGKFVTEEGSMTGGNASFKGYLPEGFTKATGGSTFSAIVCNEFNSSYTFTHEPSNPRYVFYCNIPSEQDGTGLKYTLFGTPSTWKSDNVDYYLSYDEGTKELGPFNFNVKSSLCALTLPAGSNVVKMEITMSYDKSGTNSPASQFLVSNGNKQDLKWQADNFTCLGGGGCNTITIYNNGNVLPEVSTPVYFACIRTQSGTKYGLCTLTFKFTNADGLVAEKAVPLKKGNSFVNIGVGNKLNNFGTIPLTAEDFKTVE